MSQQAKSFLDDLVEVCRKHGLSLAHEDIGGNFVVEPFKESNIEWLRNASERQLPEEPQVSMEWDSSTDFEEARCKDKIDECLVAARASNWGICRESLSQVLDITDNGDLFSQNGLYLFWASAWLLHLNYGEELLALMRERKDDFRYRPWYEAVSALHCGDKRYLQNTCFEARSTATQIFDDIEGFMKTLPADQRRTSPAAKQKKRKKDKSHQ